MFSLSLSWAQSCTVCVDMNGYTGSEPITSGVNIQSNIINNWSIQTPENVLTDPDGDGIYCTTVSAPVGTVMEYLFYVGEPLLLREAQGALFGLRGACPEAILNNAEFPNRLHTIGAEDATIIAPWEGCPVAPGGGGGEGGELTVGYNPALADPCSCTDPQNVTNPDGSVTHFHDILSVTNGGAGAVVTLVDNGGVFLGTGLSPIANNTMLGTTDAAGNLNVDFFHTSGATGTIMVDVGGTVLPFTVDACDGSTCVTIPTMSEWGLMIFGLLILNLGVVFVYRQEEYVLSV